MGINYNYKTGTKYYKQKSFTKSLKFLIILPIFFLLFIVYLGNSWYRNGLKAISTTDNKVSFTVNDGESLSSVITRLDQEKIIKSGSVLTWYTRFHSLDHVKAGKFSLNLNESAPQILDKIINQEIKTVSLTIHSGEILSLDIKPELAKVFSAESLEQGLSTPPDSPIIKDLPLGQSLEGYLLPETYNDLTENGDFSEFLTRQFALMEDRFGSDLAKIKTDHQLNTHEAFSLASIIQQESPVPEDQKMIAGVYYNRLKEDMSLGAEPTWRYAAKVAGVSPSIDIESPYNMQTHTGLPPGPIGTFEVSAIKAIADPGVHDYLYFVAGDDGQIYYAKTLKEHNANVAAHCDKLCQI